MPEYRLGQIQEVFAGLAGRRFRSKKRQREYLDAVYWIDRLETERNQAIVDLTDATGKLLDLRVAAWALHHALEGQVSTAASDEAIRLHDAWRAQYE